MKYAAAIFLIVLFVGCKNSAPSEFTSGNGPSGIAKLFDANGAEQPPAGILVTEVRSGKTTVSDASGKWKFSTLTSGTYDLLFTKAGYGEVKVFNASDTSTDNQLDLTIPSSEVINFQLFRIISGSDSIPTYAVTAKVPIPWLDRRSLALCVSTDSLALCKNPSSAPLNFQIVPDAYTTPSLAYEGSFTWSSNTAQAAHDNLIPHGAKVYAVLCVSGKGPNCEFLSNYDDPVLHKQIFTALGPFLQVRTAIMP
jgi:hypothetical protein